MTVKELATEVKRLCAAFNHYEELLGNVVEHVSVAENTSKLTNRAYLFIVENCNKTSEQKLDQTENISLFITDFDNAVDMVMNQEIISGITAYGILYAKTRRNRIG